MNRISTFSRTAIALCFSLVHMGISAQTNVFDDVIATSPEHTYLKAALEQEGLDQALQSSTSTLTVFAPTNAAFDDLAAQLNTDITGLLNLPNLTDVLLYHVLNVTVPSSAITNGTTTTPLNTANTLKLTKTQNGSVFVNQAAVSTADITADNGVVHVTNGVLLPVETVVDVAIDNGFTALQAAVAKAELTPALSNPFATFTVFAPTDSAFTALATALNTDINGLLASPQLADILLYHVLGTEATSSSITNGAIVNPLNTANTLKLTKTTAGNVFVNQAQVTLADVPSGNGVVHVINKVVLPNETVLDIAIDNGFTSLVAAVVKAELVPALSDPFSEFTVFAPTNTAFSTLATNLNTDINGLLALPNLSDILLYHVVSGTVLSNQLSNGNVQTLNGQNILVDITNGVKINDASVTTADLTCDNGVVHVIDAVLVPTTLSVNENEITDIRIYPNPTTDVLMIENTSNGQYEIVDNKGSFVASGTLTNGRVDVSSLTKGNYFIKIKTTNGYIQKAFIRL